MFWKQGANRKATLLFLYMFTVYVVKIFTSYFKKEMDLTKDTPCVDSKLSLY